MKKVPCYLRLSAFLGLSFVVTQSVSAQEFSFNGFATLGMAYSDSDTLGYRNTLKQKSTTSLDINTDTLLGLQSNIKFSDNFDAVIQAVFKDRVSEKVSDNLEWAFLRYRLNRKSAIRVGRVNTDLYLLSEYKNVRYAYTWARPPAEQYSIVSTVSSLDGLDARFTSNLGSGFFEISLAWGEATQSLNDGTEEIEAELQNILAGSSSYHQDNWLARASFIHLTIDNVRSSVNLLVDELSGIPPMIWPQAPALAQYLNPEDTDISYAGLGYQYDDNHYIFSTELGYTNAEWGSMPQETFSGYASLGLVRNNFTYYFSLATTSTHQNPVEITSPEIMTPELEFLTTVAARNQARIDQHTFSAGVKWNIRSNMNINFQWDHSVVHDAADLLWTREKAPERNENINLISASLNIVF